jgi:Clustered mitochondria
MERVGHHVSFCTRRENVPFVSFCARDTRFLIVPLANDRFKFARDVELRAGCWMYGGDQRSDGKAMKAANQELLGLKSYYATHTPGLCVPLMCMLDFSGFRLVCVSRLPIGACVLTPIR